jgi:hypothetical protein
MKGPISIIRAFVLGVREGYASPYGYGTGMTYDESPHSPRSRAYDRGLNVGEPIGRRFNP